jgi:hypothetical protein
LAQHCQAHEGRCGGEADIAAAKKVDPKIDQ